MISLKEMEQIMSEEGIPFKPMNQRPSKNVDPPQTGENYYMESLKDLGTGVATGFGNTWGGIQQLLGGDKQRLEQENMQRQQRYEQASLRSPWAAGSGNILGMISSTPPIPGLGQAGLAAKLATNPTVRKILGGLMTGTAEGAVGAGLQYVPEGQSRQENIQEGALFGGGAGGVFGVGSAAYQALKPSNFFRGKLSPEELMQNLQATQGSRTGLGQVLENPSLAMFQENILNKFPLSGASKTMNQEAAQIIGKGDKLLGNISGGGFPSREKLGSIIQQGLKDVEKDVQKMKRDNYSIVDKEAEKMGVKIGRGNFASTANTALNEIKRSPELAGEFPKQVLAKLRTYGNPEVTASLKDTNIFRGLLGDYSEKAFREGNRYEGNIYRNLKNSLDADINQGIENSGSPVLKEAYDKAQRFYRDEIAPLEAPEISKFLRGDADPDTLINSFFKNTKGQDRSILLEKLTGQLSKSENSDELMNALRYGIFSKAKGDGGKVNPNALTNIFNNIGPNQRQLLFKGKEKELEKLENYSNLVSKNQAALTQMLNPKTGAQLSQVIPYGGALAGGTQGFMMGGPVGALLGAGVGAGAGWGQLANRLLTSEKTRENLVKQMINPSVSNTEKLVSALSRNVPRAAGVASSNKKKEEKK